MLLLIFLISSVWNLAGKLPGAPQRTCAHTSHEQFIWNQSGVLVLWLSQVSAHSVPAMSPSTSIPTATILRQWTIGSLIWYVCGFTTSQPQLSNLWFVIREIQNVCPKGGGDHIYVLLRSDFWCHDHNNNGQTPITYQEKHSWAWLDNCLKELHLAQSSN